MSRKHYQVKVPEELVIHIRAYQSQHNLKTDSAVMLHMLTAFLGVGNHAQFSLPLPERLPKTPKRKATWKPLSAHTKARMQVLRGLEARLDKVGATTSELSRMFDQNTNNIAKRLAELEQEGYAERRGDYRVSYDSTKRLAVWYRTDKPLPEGL